LKIWIGRGIKEGKGYYGMEPLLPYRRRGSIPIFYNFLERCTPSEGKIEKN
jgi:hypothetical protein